MIDLKKVSVRVNKAVDEFPSYIASVVRNGREFTVANKYTVNIDLATCTCRDNVIRGEETPCKHIIIVWLYIYGEKRQESDPFR